ncbi:MAG: hypothetical protein IPM51_12260 [Sphingobacteriaceae bacterium]|nr:hypothetical protein [Sphingobacteriaceae bacterium]
MEKEEQKIAKQKEKETRAKINANKKDLMYYVKKINFYIANDMDLETVCYDDNKHRSVKALLSKLLYDLQQY